MDDKSEIYRQIVTGIVNRLLTAASALLIAKGFLTADQATFLITEAAGVAFAGIVLIWLWVKKHAEAKLQQKQIEIALDAPASTPISVVKTQAKIAVQEQA